MSFESNNQIILLKFFLGIEFLLKFVLKIPFESNSIPILANYFYLGLQNFVKIPWKSDSKRSSLFLTHTLEFLFH